MTPSFLSPVINLKVINGVLNPLRVSHTIIFITVTIIIFGIGILLMVFIFITGYHLHIIRIIGRLTC